MQLSLLMQFAQRGTSILMVHMRAGWPESVSQTRAITRTCISNEMLIVVLKRFASQTWPLEHRSEQSAVVWRYDLDYWGAQLFSAEPTASSRDQFYSAFHQNTHDLVPIIAQR